MMRLLAKMIAQEATDASPSKSRTACTTGLASSTRSTTEKSLPIAPLRKQIPRDGARLQTDRIEAGHARAGIDQLHVAAPNRLLKIDCRTAEALQFRRDGNFIIEHRGLEKVDVDVHDRKLQLPLIAQLRLPEPEPEVAQP